MSEIKILVEGRLDLSGLRTNQYAYRWIRNGLRRSYTIPNKNDIKSPDHVIAEELTGDDHWVMIGRTDQLMTIQFGRSPEKLFDNFSLRLFRDHVPLMSFHNHGKQGILIALSELVTYMGRANHLVLGEEELDLKLLLEQPNGEHRED